MICQLKSCVHSTFSTRSSQSSSTLRYLCRAPSIQQLSYFKSKSKVLDCQHSVGNKFYRYLIKIATINDQCTNYYNYKCISCPCYNLIIIMLLLLFIIIIISNRNSSTFYTFSKILHFVTNKKFTQKKVTKINSGANSISPCKANYFRSDEPSTFMIVYIVL